MKQQINIDSSFILHPFPKEIVTVAVSVVAIVGRPNVGKSSLFNWLAGKRIAIVDPTAGVTRDRLAALVQAGDRYVELLDTGGMGMKDVDDLTAHVERQIEIALAQAQVILFVVDGRDGLTPLDQEVASRLRSVNRPVICVVNKCDTAELQTHAVEFYQSGLPRSHCRQCPAASRHGRVTRLPAPAHASAGW